MAEVKKMSPSGRMTGAIFGAGLLLGGVGRLAQCSVAFVVFGVRPQLVE